MNIVRRKEVLALFLGDIIVFIVSLYLALTFRYGALPLTDVFLSHLVPFSVLFLLTILIYFIAGLYEKHTLVLKGKLPAMLSRAQVINAVISIVFFYFIPYFTITPKITLFMYLVISLIIMVAWRMAIAETLGVSRRSKALLIAKKGSEAEELYQEINNNKRYGTIFVEWIDPSASALVGEDIVNLVSSRKISLVIADFGDVKVDGVMPALYKLIFSGIQFGDIQEVYEEIFDRVPLSMINDTWFLENVSLSSKSSFDIFKRIMDIVLSAVGGIISLVFYPFVYFAIKLDDQGPIFITQERVGKNNQTIKIKKFRTMTTNDNGNYGTPVKNQVTRIGSFLRKSRIDELPQLWSVFIGESSLIGPRPELPSLAAVYEETIPYYNVRHIVKPGLFGWAQIQHQKHPHHGADVEETKNKLSYDLYYIKNRAVFLELKILIQTTKILLSFVGR